MNSVRHLYVHTPFCPHICPYCSFHVLPVHKIQMEQVVQSILDEHQNILENLALETLYFGGGTPTALPIALLQKLIPPLIQNSSNSLCEASMECNPSTLSVQKAEALLECGINRISIGAQSFTPATLTTLGRTHSAEAIEKCVENARIAGFENINLDLIFGVPGQTLEGWRHTLKMAFRLNPHHISCYGLTYEEDTEFFLRHRHGELKSNSELEKAMFDFADQFLTGEGFDHYEISNYARPGFECQHNLGYWRGKDYFGIGPSAVSTVEGIRRVNSKLEKGSWKTSSKEQLSQDTLAGERMALGLRTNEGVEPLSFASQFGFSPENRWGQAIQSLIEAGLLLKESSYRLTRRGREVADEIAVYFV